jgi:hypothetical protein
LSIAVELSWVRVPLAVPRHGKTVESQRVLGPISTNAILCDARGTRKTNTLHTNSKIWLKRETKFLDERIPNPGCCWTELLRLLVHPMMADRESLRQLVNAIEGNLRGTSDAIATLRMAHTASDRINMARLYPFMKILGLLSVWTKWNRG